MSPTPPPDHDGFTYDALWPLTAREVREHLAFLQAHREAVRDAELLALSTQAARLLRDLDALEAEKVAVEVRCFRDVLALYRRLRDDG